MRLTEPSGFVVTLGRGLQCEVEGVPVLLGNRAWMQQHGLHLASAQESEVAGLELQGHTVVLVAVRGALAGMLAVSDTLKPEAAGVVQQLRGRGVEVWCVSGDTNPSPNPNPNLQPQP